MKTAISIPDELFAAADALARELGQSRSHLYAQAVREYLARHSSDGITEALDAVWTDVADEDRSFIAEAARRTLERTEW
ncbi:MAG: ribbon-helix-helix protein, CopG family [Actinobacteria bacterium]|nr:ribbon-helix-helix protein, CopG family [Actinomycetota bacterium]